MEKEQQIYDQQGMEEYIKHQVEHEMQPFSPGPAFFFVKVRDGGGGGTKPAAHSLVVVMLV